MNLFAIFQQIRGYSLPKLSLLAWIILSFFLIIIGGLLIWFYGSRLGYGDFRPLGSIVIRLTIIGLAIIAWLVLLLFSLIRARQQRKNDAVQAQYALQKAQDTGVAAMRRQWQQALNHMRKIARKRSGFIYEKPWYLLIGAAETGKSAALRSCAYHPFASTLPEQSAGTAEQPITCQWWQGEDAILIETTSPQIVGMKAENPAVYGWNELLRLLKKYRRAQPLNGIIVTVTASDLLNGRLEEVEQSAEMLRQRLDDVTTYFKIKVPVYIILTKADLLSGFAVFFNGFSAAERNQVWGITLPSPAELTTDNLPNLLGEEFTLLQQNIECILLDRFQQETDNAARGHIFRFATDLAALKEPLGALIAKLGTTAGRATTPFLRGVYFTSAMPSGKEYAQPRPEGRGYFIKPLLQKLIFNEAALVMRDKYLSRHRLYKRFGVFVVAILVCIIVGINWINSFLRNREAIRQAQNQLSVYEQLAKDIPVRNISDNDFLRILPSLDSLLASTTLFESSFYAPDLTFGRSDKITNKQNAIYRNALNKTLLPRLMVQLQNQLDKKQDSNSTFDNLKFYSMLGGHGTIDRRFAAIQAQHMFDQLYPGEGRITARNALVQHVNNLVSGPLDPIETDPLRIDKARKDIRNLEVAERAFNLLLARGTDSHLAMWQPAQALGPVGKQAFERKSGHIIQDGIAGIYTRDGYAKIVAPSLNDIVEEALSEYWVRGEQISVHQPTSDELSLSLIQQYFDGFSKSWNTALTDLKIRSPQNLSEAAETARLLSASPSPLEALARSIAEATNLGNILVEGNDTNTTLEVPDPYGALRDALAAPKQASHEQGTDGKQAPDKSLFGVLQPQLQAASEQLALAATSTAEVSQIFGVESGLYKANNALVKEARILPTPLNLWIAGMAADNSSFAIRAARANISTVWMASGAQLCNSIVDGRYPFDRRASNEVTMIDFVRLFGPKGLFQTFFNQQLKPFVDTTTTPWRWHGASDPQQPANQALIQFQNADLITRAFFPSGGEAPAVKINISPVALSEAANAVMLEIEGERVVYFHGPKQAKTIIWPAQQNAHFSRIMFQPGGWQNAVTINGDWSPLRLLDQATVQEEDANHFQVRFSNQSNFADFNIQFGSVLNPFRLQALREFRCPVQF